MTTLRLFLATVRRALSRPVSSSHRLRASSESSRLVPAHVARPLDVMRLPWGWLVPHRDINQQRRHDRFPRLPPSVLGVSHALDGLIRHQLCGFVSPRSHVQGSLFRGSPFHPAASPHRWLVPSRRWRPCAAVGVTRRRHAWPLRPQGFHPGGNPLLDLWDYLWCEPDPLLSFSSSRCSLSTHRERFLVLVRS